MFPLKDFISFATVRKGSILTPPGNVGPTLLELLRKF